MAMRVLVVAPGPSFSVADVQRGWERALERQGHTVRTYNLDARLTTFSGARWPDDDGGFTTKLTTEEAVRLAVEPLGNACYRFWPDVIIVVSGFFVPDDIWQVWKQRTHKTVMLCTESPYEDLVQFERMVNGEPDIMLLNDPVNIDNYRAHHPNVHYSPHAYDPDVHTPGRATRKLRSDFAFIGTGYSSRLDFFSRVNWRGVDVKLGGMMKSAVGTVLEPFIAHNVEDCLDNDETVAYYRSCKASANLYRARSGSEEAHDPRLARGWAVGPREIELAATRTFFLREPREEGDELFPNLPVFRTPGEFEEQLRWYLAHDGPREQAALLAREAIRDRTFDANARRLMQLLDA